MPQASNSTSDPTPLTTPIAKIPPEVWMRIFEDYVESYPEVRDQRVVDLCLVCKYWNNVANDTPRLWTKINLSFPFDNDLLDAMRKRIHASRSQEIDVSIDFRNPDPNWEGEEPDYDGDGVYGPTSESIWAREIRDLLVGTEKRWRSIKVVSSTWLPFYELTKDWKFTHLPSLESVSMKRDNDMFGMEGVPYDPQTPDGPTILFDGRGTLPKLRDLSLSAIPVDWNGGLNGCQNLRKIKINNLPRDVAPSFEQFANFLSLSPRLEYLDVSGYCPWGHSLPPPPGAWDPPIPIVRLPMLKEFVFSWKVPENSCSFLEMFQIGNSLETLTLKDTESGSSHCREPQGWPQSSEVIFNTLHELGSRDLLDEDDDTIPGPFISMRGVKRLKIMWTKADRASLIPFLTTLTEVEDILLEDVDEGVLEDVTSVQIERSRAMMGRPLRIDLRWMWQDEVPVFAEQCIQQLEAAGIETTVHEVVED